MVCDSPGRNASLCPSTGLWFVHFSLGCDGKTSKGKGLESNKRERKCGMKSCKWGLVFHGPAAHFGHQRVEESPWAYRQCFETPPALDKLYCNCPTPQDRARPSGEVKPESAKLPKGLSGAEGSQELELFGHWMKILYLQSQRPQGLYSVPASSLGNPICSHQEAQAVNWALNI